MRRLFYCEKCGVPVDNDNVGCFENNWCVVCEDKRVAEEIARFKPLNEAEKRAGLLVYLDELEQAIRDAGRGHLLKD